MAQTLLRIFCYGPHGESAAVVHLRMQGRGVLSRVKSWQVHWGQKASDMNEFTDPMPGSSVLARHDLAVV